MFLKLQCQHWKIIGGAGFVYCVSEGCGLDLGSWVGCGGCGFQLGSSLDPRVYWNNKRAVSAEERGVTQGASSEASPLLLFFPPAQTHTESWPPTRTPPRLADMRTARLSPLPQWIFHLPEASDTSKPARLHIWAIMWSSDGKTITPPRTLMLLLTCYYAVIKSENAIWCWRHLGDLGYGQGVSCDS